MPSEGAVASLPAPRPAARRPGAWLVRHWHPFATALLVVALIGLWELLAATEAVDPILLAPPAEVASALWSLFGEGAYWKEVWVTGREMMIGWAGASVLALAVAILMTRWARLREAVYPYIVVFAATPKVILLPIIVALAGPGMIPTIAFIIIACFFPVYVNAFLGLTQASRESRELMRSLRATAFQRYRMLLIPRALPATFTGLKAAMAVAALGAVVGEFYGAPAGLGYLINVYAFNIQIDYVYAAIISVALVSIVLYFAVELLGRLLIRWPGAGD